MSYFLHKTLNKTTSQSNVTEHIAILESKNTEMDKIIEQMEGKSGVDVDEAVIPIAPIYKQFVLRILLMTFVIMSVCLIVLWFELLIRIICIAIIATIYYALLYSYILPHDILHLSLNQIYNYKIIYYILNNLLN